MCVLYYMLAEYVEIMIQILLYGYLVVVIHMLCYHTMLCCNQFMACCVVLCYVMFHYE